MPRVHPGRIFHGGFVVELIVNICYNPIMRKCPVPLKKNNIRQSIRLLHTEEAGEVRHFWQDRSPEERLAAVEFLREQCYLAMGYRRRPRLKRVVRLVERS